MGSPSGLTACAVVHVSGAQRAATVPSPPSATGHTSTVQPASTIPSASACATSIAVMVPLKESGASTTCGIGGALLIANAHRPAEPGDRDANRDGHTISSCAHCWKEGGPPWQTYNPANGSKIGTSVIDVDADP